eukprot:1876749-Rhodomonas_salina.4
MQTWGVWISQSRERSMVWSTKWPSALSLTVAFIGTASTAASRQAEHMMSASLPLIAMLASIVVGWRASVEWLRHAQL